MIPKIIHYCWFGRNPLSEKAKNCIESWRKFLPDYDIKEWNEDNFDVAIIKYTAEAYRLKKYAFVSDYARFWILYHYGGVYFDVDVELVKPIDDILAKGAFMGCEEYSLDYSKLNPATGLGIAAPIQHPFYAKILAAYSNKHFVNWCGVNKETVVGIITNLINTKECVKDENGIAYIHDIYIYPSEYFCPLNFHTGELTITDKTRSIHHYQASWVNRNGSIFMKVKRRLRNIYVRVIVFFLNK